jgi:hypothetical protein
MPEEVAFPVQPVNVLPKLRSYRTTCYCSGQAKADSINFFLFLPAGRSKTPVLILLSENSTTSSCIQGSRNVKMSGRQAYFFNTDPGKNAAALVHFNNFFIPSLSEMTSTQRSRINTLLWPMSSM